MVGITWAPRPSRPGQGYHWKVGLNRPHYLDRPYLENSKNYLPNHLIKALQSFLQRVHQQSYEKNSKNIYKKRLRYKTWCFTHTPQDTLLQNAKTGTKLAQESGFLSNSAIVLPVLELPGMLGFDISLQGYCRSNVSMTKHSACLMPAWLIGQ